MQADPKFWDVMLQFSFQLLGIEKGQYHYNEQTYQMGGHGFARDNDFELIKNPIMNSFLSSVIMKMA
ncbi:hypothetical protein QK908_03385 [Lactococcus cremoris]